MNNDQPIWTKAYVRRIFRSLAAKWNLRSWLAASSSVFTAPAEVLLDGVESDGGADARAANERERRRQQHNQIIMHVVGRSITLINADQYPNA